MILPALIWAIAALATGFLYADRPMLTVTLRLSLLAILEIVSMAVLIWLCGLQWRIWMVVSLLELYRVINLARFYRRRLPLSRLNSLTLRAHAWLAALQAIVALVSWIIITQTAGAWLLAAIVVAQLIAALVLLRSSIGTWRYTRAPLMSAPLTDKQLPSLSVLIPARNETEMLEHCLRQLIASNYPKLEILVLDDNSTNRHTSEVVRSFAHDGVRFIQGAEPDESHWLAKNRAYARLREEATGELLLFCGVDARFDPGSIRQLVEISQARKKTMLSILPLRAQEVAGGLSLLQPMRYYWELCLPRRFFKRPPVLSTCWLITAATLDAAGGFQAVAHSVTPEAYFARQAVVHNAYSFIRSDLPLGIHSAKPNQDQYDTSVRMRYPQLHRRLELVAFTSLIELTVFIGPVVGLILVLCTNRSSVYGVIWLICIACVLATYYLAAVSTGLNRWWTAWIIMPAAFCCDIVLQHVSLYKYEFSRVEWKGRDIAPAVMQVIPRLPPI